MSSPNVYLHTNGCCGDGVQAPAGGPQSNLNPRSVEDGRGERKSLKCGISQSRLCNLNTGRLAGVWIGPSRGKEYNPGYSACVYPTGVCADEPTHTHRSNTVTFKTKYQNDCVCAPQGRERCQTQPRQEVPNQTRGISHLHAGPVADPV